MKRLLMILVPVIALSGCMTVTRTEGKKVDKDKVVDLKPGSTTRQAVLQLFGSPTEIAYENNEEKMVYSFKERKVPAYFGGMIENEITGSESKTTLELIFRNDVLYSYRFKSSQG